MTEYLSLVEIDQAQYNIINEFATVEEYHNSLVDVRAQQHNTLYKDCLILGFRAPEKQSKGVVLFVGKTKYPVFLPFDCFEVSTDIDADPGTITFESVQKKLDDVDVGDVESNKKLILLMCKLLGVKIKNQKCYVMATAQHESGFIPQDEALSLRLKRGYTETYYGRGFIQLTGEALYKYYTKVTGIDLINYPDKANDCKVAAYIIVHAMKFGVPRPPHKLSTYINNVKTDFFNAREIVNSNLDAAQTIADYAESWKTEIDKYDQK